MGEVKVLAKVMKHQSGDGFCEELRGTARLSCQVPILPDPSHMLGESVISTPHMVIREVGVNVRG